MNVYFKNDNPPRDNDGNKMVWFLIAVNFVMFLLLARPHSMAHANLTLYCNPEQFHFYQLVTAGFLHSDFSHILFNMWGLYLFGTLFANRIGKWNFLWLYLVGVVVGNLIFMGSYWGGMGGILGASGAVCAVMMGAAMFEPERRFSLLFFPFGAIKTTTLVICYTILEMLFEVAGAQAGVAHLAHLGGFLGGYIFLRIMFGREVAWDPFRKRGIHAAPPPRASGFPWGTPPPSGAATGPVTSQELDALLDKISREGINALSEAELQRLRQAREQMRGR